MGSVPFPQQHHSPGAAGPGAGQERREAAVNDRQRPKPGRTAQTARDIVSESTEAATFVIECSAFQSLLLCLPLRKAVLFTRN